VTGANGFVGRSLIPELVERGYSVNALVRDATSFEPRAQVDIHPVDVGDTATLAEALSGCDVAYYLVHAMAGGEGFEERDRALARSFATAAASAEVRRIVYLGGLGHGTLSAHLASRQEVGEVLGSTGVPVVELRAAVVLGAGSISFEMVRYLTERLPMMVCPKWVNTRVQPIAARDLMAYLAEAAGVEAGVYEVGCPDVTTYREMMDAYARVRGLRPRFIIKVPVLSPSLSAHWVDLVTPVDSTVSHTLIESLTNEVTVRTREHTHAAFSIRPLTVEEAIDAALEEQARRITLTLFQRPHGLEDGVYTDHSEARVRAGSVGGKGEVEGVELDLDDCGGQLSWYGLPYAWQMRISLGHLFGEDLRLGRPAKVGAGAQVDWWTVELREPQTLVLSCRTWFCGEAWLGFRVSTTHPARIEQVGALRTRGLVGVAYWWLLWPIHQLAFRAMVHHRVVRARRMARRGRRGRRHDRH
jgi:uncharacterized protein YbjT (DUF2867 family)